MINEEILLKNGYIKYRDNLYNAEALYQKKIMNERRQIKYFIDIYKYSENYEVRLNTEKDKYNLDILLFNIDKDMALDEIEREIYAIWYDLNCKYYGEEEEI